MTEYLASCQAPPIVELPGGQHANNGALAAIDVAHDGDAHVDEAAVERGLSHEHLRRIPVSGPGRQRQLGSGERGAWMQ